MTTTTLLTAARLTAEMEESWRDVQPLIMERVVSDLRNRGYSNVALYSTHLGWNRISSTRAFAEADRRITIQAAPHYLSVDRYVLQIYPRSTDRARALRTKHEILLAEFPSKRMLYVPPIENWGVNDMEVNVVYDKRWLAAGRPRLGRQFICNSGRCLTQEWVEDMLFKYHLIEKARRQGRILDRLGLLP